MDEPTPYRLLQDVVTMEPYWRPEDIQLIVNDRIDPEKVS